MPLQISNTQFFSTDIYSWKYTGLPYTDDRKLKNKAYDVDWMYGDIKLKLTDYESKSGNDCRKKNFLNIVQTSETSQTKDSLGQKWDPLRSFPNSI